MKSEGYSHTNQLRSISVQAPGRINIIGEHTDYNDGFVMPAAIDKRIVMRLKRNGTDGKVLATAGDYRQEFRFRLDRIRPVENGWRNYIMGVVDEMQKAGARLSGFDASFGGNVPIGSGMSSSAALECSLAFALNESFGLGFDRLRLAALAQQAESLFVGMRCGIMDQFASLMGRKDHAILLDCRTMSYRYYPLIMGEYGFLLLHTNVFHSLASSEYNTRRSECEEGVSIIQKSHPGVRNLREVDGEMLESMRGELPDLLYRRCRHVLTENQRVLDAAEALTSGDNSRLGRLMYESHRSMRTDFEISCPELDFLVDLARTHAFVAGSRLMGGGFGGCTINLVRTDRMEEFIDIASAGYRNRFGIDLTPYRVSIEDGARRID